MNFYDLTKLPDLLQKIYNFSEFNPYLNRNLFEALNATFLSDYEQLLEAVIRDGIMLQFAHPKLRANCDIVGKAVSRNGLALQFAHPKLRANCDIVKRAVRQNGLALQFAHPELKADCGIVKLAVGQNGLAYQFVTDIPTIKYECAYMSIAIEQNPNALQFGPQFSNTPIIVRHAVEIDGMTLQFASDKLRADPDIIDKAIKQNSEARQFAIIK